MKTLFLAILLAACNTPASQNHGGSVAGFDLTPTTTTPAPKHAHVAQRQSNEICRDSNGDNAHFCSASEMARINAVRARGGL